ncbi:MAG: DUF4422 domain-containing protein [Ruminococcaceae bacterium]|nr:DUF4422 domain-containing protein [Oscillospiraceae bacterium]
MLDIKIYVAAHKQFPVSKRLTPAYQILQVGSEGKASLGYLRDNTGDHISAKNASYCELTGLYWVWKNTTSDVAGLCHYRRYFSSRLLDRNLRQLLTEKEIDRILQKYDVILPRRVSLGKQTVREHYSAAHFEKDLNTTRRAIEELYPDYLKAFDEVMAMNRTYQCNMFIMRRERMNDYCEWLFEVLGYVEAHTDISEYDTAQKRIYGYLGERLLHVWVHHQQLRTCEKWFASTEMTVKKIFQTLLARAKG